MPPVKANVSVGHFEWLIEGRSSNQRSTFDLYKAIEDHEARVERRPDLQAIALDLTAIAFSLWRAVFLSDTTGEFEDQFADAKRFLISLISDNAILYATDKNARNWSFRYYLDNATMRLTRLNDSGMPLIDSKDMTRTAESEKDEWLNAQAALAKAIARFTEIVAQTPHLPDDAR